MQPSGAVRLPARAGRGQQHQRQPAQTAPQRPRIGLLPPQPRCGPALSKTCFADPVAHLHFPSTKSNSSMLPSHHRPAKPTRFAVVFLAPIHIANAAFGRCRHQNDIASGLIPSTASVEIPAPRIHQHQRRSAGGLASTCPLRAVSGPSKSRRTPPGPDRPARHRPHRRCRRMVQLPSRKRIIGCPCRQQSVRKADSVGNPCSAATAVGWRLVVGAGNGMV